ELRAAARAAGSDAPTVDAIVLRDGDVAARDRFLIRAAERRGAALRCGEARAEGRWMIVVAPAAAELLIDPDDRVLVELAEGWRQPRLYARDAAGRLWTSEVRVGEPLAIPADLERPVSLQLIAEDARGPRPVAERRLGCASGCDELEVTVSSDEPVAIRVDALRAASGRSPLRANRLLEQ